MALPESPRNRHEHAREPPWVRGAERRHLLVRALDQLCIVSQRGRAARRGGGMASHATALELGCGGVISIDCGATILGEHREPGGNRPAVRPRERLTRARYSAHVVSGSVDQTFALP